MKAIVFAVAVLAGGCGSDPVTDSPLPEPSAPPEPARASLCEGSSVPPRDAALLPVLCDGPELSGVQARDLLLSVVSVADARRVVPLLANHPDLQGLANLAALTRGRGQRPAQLPDPAAAPVAPVDDLVLGQVEVAHRTLIAEGVTHDARTRARAFLSKVFFQALQQLGYGEPKPLTPFARLLAANALYHGRRFCTAYWQRRVRGLETLFTETEVQLLMVALALELTPHFGDPAVLAVERQRARRYVQRSGPRARIAKRIAKQSGPAIDTTLLEPLTSELDRLLDHGFIDLALARGLQVAVAPGSYGVKTMEAFMRQAFTQRDLGEYTALLERRVREKRARVPPPVEIGPRSLSPTALPPWTSAAVLADQAALALSHASPNARRLEIGRAIVLARERPDAGAALLERLLDTPMAQTTGAVLAELLAAENGSDRAAFRLSTRAKPSSDPSDETRRRFALAVREANELAR